MRQTLRPEAAPIRPILRVIFAAAVVLSLFSFATRADESAMSRRDSAKAQFERAEKSRQDLEARPESARTLKDYTAVVIAYQRVYLITSHAADVPASLKAVAELFHAMGDLFDAKYYQRSIDSYQFLVQEYPTSKYREDALLAVARIQQEDLHEAAQARKTYEQFLVLHPRSSHAAEVRAQLNKLSADSTPSNSSPAPLPKMQQAASSATSKDHADRVEPKPVSMDKNSNAPSTDTKQGANDDKTDNDGSGPQVSRIRTWNADTYTRIVIDVGAKVKYQAARISAPDRIYFDIEGAKLTSALLHTPIDLDSAGLLKTIRVAQNHTNTVRVVLEVNRVSDYSVFLLPDPYRLVVDVYGTSSGAEEAARSTTPAAGPSDLPPAQSDKFAKESGAKSSPKAQETIASKSATTPPNRVSPFQVPAPAALATERPAESPENAEATSRKTASDSSRAPQKTAATASNKPNKSQGSENSSSQTAALADPATSEVLPLPSHPSWPKKSARGKKSAHDQAAEMGPPPVPDLTLDGQHSLTRALGLKIGRIVIDAGHGGHDTGTIGPTGLMEKDLCLDVALRLGKIIQQKLPSAEVVLTRSDDTFVPLERRTEIANEAKADLFVSVHANSSQDNKARGIETYYLNFTGSSDAMEVASRENALSGNAVHDLQDIVKKIASNEKIEESRDLASMIQDSLAKRMENINRGERNRGVRKAPFVVLIGADMPSVLAEISFLSNPSDESWLKRPENRQRVADGLYHGIETYLHSTNSLTSNQIRSTADNLAGKVARTGNSQ
jgi:N-acetylmuramoyl-L-alanine amidase